MPAMPQPSERPPPMQAPEPMPPPLVSGISRSDSIADLANLSWVNSLLGWLWPKANAALTQFVHDDLTQRLRESLPSPFKNLCFSRFTLGQNTPEFGPIEVSQHSETHVEVNLDMRYFGDVDILLEAGTGGIALGVRHLSFQGRLCIVFAPVLAKLPIIGAVKVFCPDVPKVSMQFTGLAAVAHYPGLDDKIQRIVDDWMRSRMVLPSRKTMIFADPDEDVDLLEVMSHQPLGVLRVRILGGRNLAGVNWKVLETDSFDSDPFCTLELGGATARTSTVQGSTSPTWPANEPSAYFVVYHRDQRLKIEVMGEDRGGLFAPRNFTGFLGSASLTVAEIMRKWPRQRGPGTRWASLKLDTAQVSRDMLHVNDPVNRGIASEVDAEVEWFDLEDGIPSVAEQHALTAGGDAPVGLLLVELRKGVGFPLEAIGGKAGLRWRSRTEPNQPASVSRRGEMCDLEVAAFPEVSLHPRLFSVVDKLVARGMNCEDIAGIVGGASAQVITQYLDAKQEHDEQQAQLSERERHDDFRVSLEWHETLWHFVHAPEATGLTLELLDGEDREIGRIGPVPLRSMLEVEVCEMRRAWRGLEVTKPNDPVGLTAWMMPREKGPEFQRFSAVELDVSAKLRFLRMGRGLPHRGERR